MTIRHFLAVEQPLDLQLQRLRIRVNGMVRRWTLIGVSIKEAQQDLIRAFADMAAIIAADAIHKKRAGGLNERERA